MADDRMAALELLRKAAGDGDLDFLRKGLTMLTQLVMDAEVTAQIGARRAQLLQRRVDGPHRRSQTDRGGAARPAHRQLITCRREDDDDPLLHHDLGLDPAQPAARTVSIIGAPRCGPRSTRPPRDRRQKSTSPARSGVKASARTPWSRPERLPLRSPSVVGSTGGGGVG
jgi:hypothetical protein